MAVEPDRRARDLVDPRSLEPLADAGRALAPGARLADVLQGIAAGLCSASGADVAIVRVLDPERAELVVRAVAAPTEALAAELEGARLPLEQLPREETALADAPAAVRRVAALVGASDALMLAVEVSGEVVASLELLREDEPFGHPERVAARIAASQIGLAVRAFGPSESQSSETIVANVRAAGDALAAAADAPHTPRHVLHLALELSGAEGGLLWRFEERDRAVLAASAGRSDGMGEPAAPGVSTAGERVTVTYGLGEPRSGLLQLLFPEGHRPSDELVETLRTFAVRAADVLRENDSARGVASELAQTRALLAVVGEAAEELSVAHALETALARVAELAGGDRLAVYLLEDDRRLTTAAARGLAGPHPRVAEALLELATGPYRARGMLAVPDAAAEPRLGSVADAVAESGIEGVIALPLVVGHDVTGLLCVYTPRGRMLEPGEAGLFSAVAGRLAVAVENARLHEEATRLGTELEQALALERKAARRLAALYEISRVFAQSMRLDRTLDAVARTVVGVLDTDAAVLRMFDQRREQLLPLAVHVRDEELLGPVRSILLRPQRFGTGPSARVFESGEAIVLDAAAAAEDGAPHELLVPFLEKGSTAAIVPIATPAEVLASLTLVSLHPDRPVDSRTIDAARALAGQAALAIDNARLYQQREDFADAMQRSLLPRVRPPVDGLDIGQVYAPPGHERRQRIGGDLYDYLLLEDGRLAVVLGDVTGHGVEAAADMAMAKYVFRSLAREHPEPADFLAAANDIVGDEIGAGKFITMLYLLIDTTTGEVVCACAGHPPPRVIRADGSVGVIEAKGLALGIEPSRRYEPVRDRLEHGDVLVLYTDGVIEARRDGELFGTERLDAVLARRRARRAQDIAMVAVESARRFSGGELADDCAVVVLKRR